MTRFGESSLAAYGAPRRHLELAREIQKTSGTVCACLGQKRRQGNKPSSKLSSHRTPLMGSGNIKVLAFVPLDSDPPVIPPMAVITGVAENDGGRGRVQRNEANRLWGIYTSTAKEVN